MELSREDLSRQIDRTTEDLARKVQVLEDKAHVAKERISRTVDVRAQIEDHPMAALGAAFAVGLVFGALTAR